ncbi:phosphonate metabolism protein/1,5-bisphosphokinase (PRPP-forming) PhnN [Advenella sp. WQ 585]|uniref:ribose 1,5-bisphosphate phosphokinase n=1 Tax=Advenella mandrilli TaxID=2800330 RepID=A0ABS1EDA7_9BURK|nr:phosphonate metabolism protein/1,5-bisphosphokinase (PRPP-forming) PhnN [Advenella mandrilli]MBK1781939.1 phosphonate metabolism protein/1,5-bisphosphokinase (PRPP-forming) PhnN [Advenella mandrilli]
MAGKLVYMVGPSGSGKDSLLQALENGLPDDCIIMKRVITRPENSPGEVADSVSMQVFEQIEAEGGFSMSWRANGLAYGIPKDLDRHLAEGKTVLVNGSRSYCTHVSQLYPDVIIVLVAVKPELLRQRLVNRGRESLQEITLRLERNSCFEQVLQNKLSLQQLSFFLLDNSGDLKQAVGQLRDKLEIWCSAGMQSDKSPLLS